MVSILVTSIGSFSAKAIISSLNRLKEYIVYGCDIYPSAWHACSVEFKKVFQVPEAKDEELYLSSIIRICKDYEIKYIIPTTDPEIDVYNKCRDVFKEHGIILCMSGCTAISVARNKYNLSIYFQDNPYFNIIPTYLSGLEVIDNPVFPYIAKPVNGRSSIGLYHICNMDDLLLAQKKENYVLQQHIEGDIYTVDYARNSFLGSDYSVPRQELIRTHNGAGITVRLIHDPVLSGAASLIGNKLDVNGCMNYEFIKTDDRYYLMDINPRFSAGIAFTMESGYDIVKSHLNCFTGKDIEAPVNYDDMIIAKSFIEIITSIGKL